MYIFVIKTVYLKGKGHAFFKIRFKITNKLKLHLFMSMFVILYSFEAHTSVKWPIDRNADRWLIRCVFTGLNVKGVFKKKSWFINSLTVIYIQTANVNQLFWTILSDTLRLY